MSLKPVMFFAATIAAAILAALPQANAGSIGAPVLGPVSYGNMAGGPHCKPSGGGSTLIINKPVTIYKPITIYKPVTITKNIDIDKSISIYKPVTIEKNISITKNIDASKHIEINKNIEINKSIVINKGGSASAEASAWAAASAQASASAQANVTVYGGSYQEQTIINKGGAGGEVSVEAQESCTMQMATVVKAIHAVCYAGGREFAASHMLADTWIESSYEGEVARCLPGATLKVVIGDVLQSDQGMAGTYENGQVLQCGPNEALRHYKDGMLKCAAAVPVKDCTERTNLRLYGTGDMFFSYRAQVCVTAAKTARAQSVEVTGMTMDGGVGDGAY